MARALRFVHTLAAQKAPCRALQINDYQYLSRAFSSRSSKVAARSTSASSAKRAGDADSIPVTTLVVDGNPIVHRCYHGGPSLVKSDGTAIGAVQVFMQVVMKLLKDIAPDYVTICFDRSGPSFRKEILPTYKAARTSLPSDLKLQLSLARESAEALGITATAPGPGFEADDLIAAYAIHGWKKNHRVVLVSPDKDMLQLVRNKGYQGGQGSISMYDPQKACYQYESTVLEEFGVPPPALPHLLALMGDRSDNIRGVPGIGKKTAALLIQKFQTINNLLKRLEEVKPTRYRIALETDRDLLFQNLALIQFPEETKREALVTVPLEDLRRRAAVPAELIAFLTQHELRKLRSAVEQLSQSEYLFSHNYLR